MLSGREGELATRLREAAASGQTKTVLELLEAGAPFIVDTDGQTALHQASSGGHNDTVAALLLGGCDVAIQDFSGHTALQRAASEGHVDIVKQLIKHGGTVDHQDEVHGNTALHEAAWKGFSKTVALLCKHKANFYIKNRGGFAPLHLSCQNGHNETSRVLLMHGCKPDIKNNYGDTPLHTSARYGHAGVIRILVSANCNASEQNKNGDTALHIAAAMGRRKLTKILIESGCDIDAKNKQGETALDISRRKNLSEIVSILQNPPPILSQADRETEAARHRDRDRSHSTGHASGHSSAQDKADGKGDKKRDKGSTSSKENDKIKRDKKRVRGSKDKSKSKDEQVWSPYGCHYQPDMEEFPIPDINTIPSDPLRAGEQYFLDLAGNIKKGPTSNSYACYCGPAFQKFEKKLERDKKELLRHIDSSHGKLDDKISSLEKKAKDQIFNLNQSMKESFAVERSECLDRMDRRALRERIAIERQQAVRDVSLKRDLASWLEKKLREIETKHGSNEKNAAMLRALAHRAAAQRGKRAGLSDTGGSLRRALSEELLSDVGVVEEAGSLGGGSVYKGLKVSDQPSRVRRNSAGDQADAFTLQQTSQDQADAFMLQQTSQEDARQSEIHRQFKDELVLAYSTASESQDTTSITSSSRTADKSASPFPRGDLPVSPFARGDLPASPLTTKPASPFNQHSSPLRGSRTDLSGGSGLIRPIPLSYSTENLMLPAEAEGAAQPPPPASYQAQNYQINPIRRFSTEADIHHATPLLLEPEPEPPYEHELQTNYLQPAVPPYRAPPSHLYHPRGRMGPLLPPVDEDEYVEDKEDLHRQLLNLPLHTDGGLNLPLHSDAGLNLPLHSDGGSHDSHNDSGYSTRVGASAGPSPSLSGSRPGSTDGDGTHLRTQELGLPTQPYQGHYQGSIHLSHVPGSHQPSHVPGPHQLSHIPPGSHHLSQQHLNQGPHHNHPSSSYAPGLPPLGFGVSGLPPKFGGMSSGLPPTAPRIRALQNKLKLTDINDAKGSLV